MDELVSLQRDWRDEDAYRAFLELFDRLGQPLERRAAYERGWSKGGLEGASRALLELVRQRPASPVAVAGLCIAAGETDEALVWLERGFRARSPGMTDLARSPRFDPLRSDPRFQRLLRRMNYPGTS